jgi:hypothetical protein
MKTSGSGGIAPPFFISVLHGEFHTPAALPPDKSSMVLTGQEAGCAPEQVCTLWGGKSLASAGNRTQTVQPVAMPTPKQHNVLKNTIFWVVTPCSSERVRRFGRTHRLHAQDRSVRNQQKQTQSLSWHRVVWYVDANNSGYTVKMEETYSSKTLLHIYQTTW